MQLTFWMKYGKLFSADVENEDKKEFVMRTLLVNGGSRGIGAAIVRLFAARGYRVAFTYCHSAVEAEALAKACGAVALRADSADEAAVNATVKIAEESVVRL